MQIRVLFAGCLVAVVLSNFVSCAKTAATATPDPTASAGIKVTATVSNLPASAIMLRNFMNVGILSNETLVTPSTYKLALVNFWFLKSDGTQVSVINTDEANPTYTEERPLIVDFSKAGASKELFSGTTFTAGTYTGYKMQIVYIEMALPCAFHVPTPSWETEYTSSSILDTSLTRSFRLYFNALGKYWKRDFVVELTADSGEWYWLRRGVNDSFKNFFIGTTANAHPIGGAGPTSIVDLFDAPDFWGDADSYNSSASPIIIGTHSTAGGVNATMAQSFTIPATLTEFFNIDIKVNVSNTMMFGEHTNTAPAGVTFFSNVLDLGPSGGVGDPMPIYGDAGLHPLMPIFTITVANGSTDTKATAEKAFQVPKACADGGWLEPAACGTNYCGTHATDEFCVAYAARKS